MKGAYNLWDAAKTRLKGKFVALNRSVLLDTKELSLDVTYISLRSQKKSKLNLVNGKKKKVKINAIGNRHTIEKKQ